jgi:hypothetical protein
MNLASFCALQNCTQIRCMLMIYKYTLNICVFSETYLNDPGLGLLLDTYFPLLAGTFSLLCSLHVDRLRLFACNALRVLHTKR